MAHPGHSGTFPAVRRRIMDTKSNCSGNFYSILIEIKVNVKKSTSVCRIPMHWDTYRG